MPVPGGRGTELRGAGRVRHPLGAATRAVQVPGRAVPAGPWDVRSGRSRCRCCAAALKGCCGTAPPQPAPAVHAPRAPGAGSGRSERSAGQPPPPPPAWPSRAAAPDGECARPAPPRPAPTGPARPGSTRPAAASDGEGGRRRDRTRPHSAGLAVAAAPAVGLSGRGVLPVRVAVPEWGGGAGRGGAGVNGWGRARRR